MVKNLFKTIAVSVVAFCSTLPLSSQDIHFSQYNASPMLLNPAMAGLNAGDYRVYANFRTQWVTLSKGNTYRTFAGGADMCIGKITKYNSFAGVGISFFSDQAGALNLSSNHVDVTFAYHFMLNRKGTMQISAGLQGGFNHRSINPANAVFDSQYDPVTGLVDPNGTRESFGRTRVMFADAGFGLIYSAMTRKHTNIYFGVALNHLNQPKISFRPNGTDEGTAGEERLPIKTTIHGGVSVPVTDRIDVMPNFLVLVQGSTYEFNVGCHVKAKVGNVKMSKTAVSFGAQYRGLFDAVIVSGRLDIKGISCGLSYDINVSKLLPASNSVGAPEISLMYQGALRKKPRPGHCLQTF